MIEIDSQVEIACPADEVFGVVADMARNPEWQKGMRTCTWTSEPPMRVGSTYDQVATFLGRDVITSFEVVELEPGRLIRIVSTKSTFPLDITRSVEPLDEQHCRVVAVVKGDPGRMFMIAGPLMRAMVRRSVRGDYARLKTLLEG